MLNAAGDKSFVDDLVASGYCKCESSLCCYEALRFIPRFYDLFFLVLNENRACRADSLKIEQIFYRRFQFAEEIEPAVRIR